MLRRHQGGVAKAMLAESGLESEVVMELVVAI